MLIDVDVLELLKELPDPYKIMDPQLPGVLKYRGHHYYDFYHPLLKRGYLLSIRYARQPIQHLHARNCCRVAIW